MRKVEIAMMNQGIGKVWAEDPIHAAFTKDSKFFILEMKNGKTYTMPSSSIMWVIDEETNE